jgi:hypothetical protein
MTPTVVFLCDAILVKVVANKIIANANTAAAAEASSKSRVGVINPWVNDGDPDPLASVLERLLDIIHASHLVSERQVGLEGLLVGRFRFGERVAFDGPNALDTRDLGQVFASVTRLDFDRGAVEEAELGTNLKRKTYYTIERDAGLCVIEAFVILWQEVMNAWWAMELSAFADRG